MHVAGTTAEGSYLCELEAAVEQGEETQRGDHMRAAKRPEAASYQTPAG
jgi:hypothetical protein